MNAKPYRGEVGNSNVKQIERKEEFEGKQELRLLQEIVRGEHSFAVVFKNDESTITGKLVWFDRQSFAISVSIKVNNTSVAYRTTVISRADVFYSYPSELDAVVFGKNAA